MEVSRSNLASACSHSRSRSSSLASRSLIAPVWRLQRQHGLPQGRPKSRTRLSPCTDARRHRTLPWRLVLRRGRGLERLLLPPQLLPRLRVRQHRQVQRSKPLPQRPLTGALPTKSPMECACSRRVSVALSCCALWPVVRPSAPSRQRRRSLQQPAALAWQQCYLPLQWARRRLEVVAIRLTSPRPPRDRGRSSRHTASWLLNTACRTGHCPIRLWPGDPDHPLSRVASRRVRLRGPHHSCFGDIRRTSNTTQSGT